MVECSHLGGSIKSLLESPFFFPSKLKYIVLDRRGGEPVSSKYRPKWRSLTHSSFQMTFDEIDIQ